MPESNLEPQTDDSLRHISENLTDLNALVGTGAEPETPRARDIRDIDEEIAYWEQMQGEPLDREEHDDDTTEDARLLSEVRAHVMHLRQERQTLDQTEGDPT